MLQEKKQIGLKNILMVHRAIDQSILAQAVKFSEKIRAWHGQPVGFFNTKIGADLWIDGYDAFISTPRCLFVPYARELLKIIRSSVGGDPLNIKNYLEAFDNFISIEGEKGEASFYHALAVGIAYLYVLGGPPRDPRDNIVVVNDSLLILLSKDYRAIRFKAYNDGVSLSIIPENSQSWFRPEFGIYGHKAPIIIEGRPKRIQFYSAIHEEAHIVLFGDVYFRQLGNSKITESLLLNIEEAVIGLDLLLFAALSRFPAVSLNALKELGTISVGARMEDSPRSELIRKNISNIAWMQDRLKVVAQQQLESNGAIARKIVDLGPKSGEISYWVDDGALKFHIAGLNTILNRLGDPIFQCVTSLIPPDPFHLSNALTSLTRSWSFGEQFFELCVPRPCANIRSKSKFHRHVKSLALKAAEIVAFGSFCQPAICDDLIDELCAWISITFSEFPFSSRTLKTKIIELHKILIKFNLKDEYRKLLPIILHSAHPIEAYLDADF